MLRLLLLLFIGCNDASAASYFNNGRYTSSKTSNQTFTTSTLTNVTDLSFPVMLAATYRFQFDVQFRSAAATNGIGLSLSVPTFSLFGAVATVPQTNDGPAGLWEGNITASDDLVLTSTVETANIDCMAMIRGIIIPTATGTVQLRARSENNGTNIIINQGSFATMEAYPL